MSGKFALIIGNTEYADPGLAQLTAPGKDTEDFARILQDEGLCAFDDVNVLLNQPSYVVGEAIDAFFYQKKPDDLLIVYFSGHGVRDEFGTLYLAVKNTNRTRLRATAIRSDYIREAMDQSRSKRQVVILDCCNSGAFPQGTKAEAGGAMGMVSALQGYGRFVLTASDATQFAWEGDKVIGETQNSVFTHFLVKGLEGEADRNSDGRITVDELYDYAFDEITKLTPKQTPTKSISKQEGEIVLRQITRIEDIKSIALPEDLVNEIEDLRPYVREAAVQKLEKIVKGRNIGLARSAREALEKIATDDNTTRRVAQMALQVLESVRQAALQVLESIHQAEQKAEEERRAQEETALIAALKAEEERLAREKADAERKAKEEAQKLLQAQIEREAAERKAARLKAEREAAEIAARVAAEKAAKEKAEKEQAAGRKARTTRPAWLIFGILGGVIIGVALCGYGATKFLPLLFGAPATQVPAGPTKTPTSAGLACAPSCQYSDLVVGFLQMGSEGSWRAANTASFKETAEQLGLKLKFYDSQNDLEKQVAGFQQFIQDPEVNVIVLAALETTGWEEVLLQAKDAGKIVVIEDRRIDAPEDLYATYISSDFAEEGRKSATEMCKLLEGMSGKKVWELVGNIDSSAAQGRGQGFREKADECGIEVTKSQTANWSVAEGKQVTEAWLKETQDVQGIFAQNDEMGLGAIEALKEAGIAPGKDVKIISDDATAGAFQAMLEGTLNVTVECNPLLAPQVYEAALKAANGEMLSKWIPSQEGVFYADDPNLQEIIAGRTY